jgi:hypothetical protein
LRLGDANFFNLLALVARNSNPGRADQWQEDGVRWIRERLSRSGPGFSMQIEVHTLSRDGSGAWTLLSAQEIWWDGARRDAFRRARWVHIVKGSRSDVVKWFNAQAVKFERNNQA